MSYASYAGGYSPSLYSVSNPYASPGPIAGNYAASVPGGSSNLGAGGLSSLPGASGATNPMALLLQILQLMIPMLEQLLGGGDAFSGGLPATNLLANPASSGTTGTSGTAGDAGNAGNAGNSGGGDMPPPADAATPSPAPASGPAPSPAPDSGGPIPDSLKDIDSKYGAMIDAAIAKHGNKVSKKYVEAEIMQESGGDARAVGDAKNSIGLLQINDFAGFYHGETVKIRTADGQEVDNPNYDPSKDTRYDASNNIDMAVGEMSSLSDQYHGDIGQIASAYETGGGSYDANYANSVINHMNGN